ncbi:MAG: spore germination protein, partial [Bacillota bacterium]|nr:spore germination protein [Bacillota bacterium]
MKNDHQTLIQNQNPSINGLKEKMNEAVLHSLFEKCKDVKFQSVHVNEHSLQLIFCEGLINSDEFNAVILDKLENFLHQQQKLSAEVIQKGLLVPDLQPIDNTEKVVSEVFSGKLLLFFTQPELTFSTNIAKMPRRKPEESKTEAAIKGPRDNFIEDLTVNVSLIRKRLR